MDEYEKHRSVLGLISQLKPGWTVNVSTQTLVIHNSWYSSMSRYYYAEDRRKTISWVVSSLGDALTYIDINNELSLLELLMAALDGATTLEQTYENCNILPMIGSYGRLAADLEKRKTKNTCRIEMDAKIFRVPTPDIDEGWEPVNEVDPDNIEYTMKLVNFTDDLVEEVEEDKGEEVVEVKGEEVVEVKGEVVEEEVVDEEEEEVDEEVVEEEVVEEEVVEEEVVEVKGEEEEVVEEEVVEEEVVEEEVAEEPEVSEPVIPEPEVSEPEVSEPEVSEPVVPEPVVPEPNTQVPLPIVHIKSKGDLVVYNMRNSEFMSKSSMSFRRKAAAVTHHNQPDVRSLVSEWLRAIYQEDTE